MSQEAFPSDAHDERRHEGITGVIDIGSNSVRLLVCDIKDGKATPLYSDLITCRLLSGISQGVLAPESIERTVNAVKRLIADARRNGAEVIHGFGTCAMREGVNSSIIVEQARSMGVEIEVLSGEDEALMAYIGASKGGKCGIIDIGGGSTELIIGENGAVKYRASAPVGAVRLYESFASRELRETVERARDMLARAWQTVSPEENPEWTGVGGTITTLAALSLELTAYSPERVCGYALSRDEAWDWLEKLYGMSVERRAALPGMKKNRADIIPFGTAILCAFFELSNAKSVSVTENDNMIGYLKLKYNLI
ncbi:MAG: hypothetical protein Q4D04_04715 [Clostridia bacterium]|nr:hypothetical protein [Clostridia bacterium]